MQYLHQMHSEFLQVFIDFVKEKEFSQNFLEQIMKQQSMIMKQACTKIEFIEQKLFESST